VGNIVRINLAFARSSLCLVHFSSDGRDGPAPRAVDEDACTVLVDEACTPTDNPLSDMTLSVIRSRSTSVTDSSTALSSSTYTLGIN
jgi:hypothetical protein